MGEFIQILRDLINIKGGMTSGSNVAWDCLNEMYVTFDTIHSNLELVESLMSIAPVMIDKVDERVVLDQLAEAAIHSLNGIDIARQRINQLVGRCSWNSVAVVKGQTILNFFEQAASLTRSIRKRIE